ncbi:MAG: radical SAM protein [Gallintestinimicrobium sp.]
MGFILTINTNGTLIDEEWAVFFGEHPPRRVNITLYGADEEDYERLCHYPGGFQKTVRGVRLLREHGIDVKISFSVAKAVRQSMGKVFSIGEELQVPVHIDPYMMPAVRERNRPFSKLTRVLPEDAAASSLEALKLQFPREIYDQYVEQTITRVEDPDFPGVTDMCPVWLETAHSPSTGRGRCAPASSCRNLRFQFSKRALPLLGKR